MSTSEFKKDILCVLFLLILVLLFFWRVVILGDYFIGGDIINQFYPWKHYLVDQTWKDRIPLWNPLTFGGNPFAANYQVGMWYLLDYIFFFIPIGDAFRVSIVLHFYLAALFMYILSRHFQINRVGSLISAIIFTFGGFLITRLSSGNYTLLTTYPWIPIIFYFFDKLLQSKKFLFLVLLSVALACQILGGHPQPAYYTLLLLSLYAVFITYCYWKEKLGIKQTLTPIFYFIVSVILAFGLSAIQMLPSLELFQYSASRAGGASYNFATFSSYGFRHLFIFFAPFFYGTSLGDTYWLDQVGYVEICGYISIVGLLLAGFGVWQYKSRTVKYILLLIGVSFFLALGNNNPLYPIFFHIIPGLRMFRCPGRWMMMVQFGLALLAGWGFHALSETDTHIEQIKKYIWQIGIIGVLLILCWFYILIGKDQIIHWLYESQTQEYAKNYSVPIQQAYDTISYDAIKNVLYFGILKQFSMGLLFFLIGGGLFFFTFKKKISDSWVNVLFPVLLVIELWNFGFWFIGTDNREEFYKNFQRSDAIQFLQKDKDPYRIITLDNVLSWQHTTDQFEYRPNRLMIHGIAETRGYDPTVLRHYSEYLNLLQNVPPDQDPGGMAHIPNSDTFNSTLVSLLNVKYISTMVPITSPKTFSQEFAGRVLLYQNQNFLPRAFYVPKAKVIPDKSVRFQEMQQASFDPKNYVILEQKPAEVPEDVYIQNTTETLENSIIPSERYSDYSLWKVNLLQNGFILFSEIWYPGWRILANGKEIPIYRADHCFRAIYLPKGTYTLEMKFLSESYYWGRKISELSIVICVILLGYGIVQIYRNKKRRL
jgi:hypothetical protein